MREIFSNIVGFLQASRLPNLISIAVAQVFASVYLLGQPVGELFTLKFIALVLSTLSITAAGYIINDYYDQKIDLINRPEKVIVGVKFKRRLAMVSHSLLNIAAILVGFWIHPFIGIIHFFAGFLLWYYSNHLRRLPFIGNLIISGMFSMALLIVSVYYLQITQLILIYSVFAFLISFIREVVKDIRDVKGEAAFGCSTIPVIWGIRGAKYVIYCASTLGIGFLLYFLLETAGSPVRLYFMIISPIFIWFLYKIHIADTQKEYSFLRSFSNWLIVSGIFSIPFIR